MGSITKFLMAPGTILRIGGGICFLAHGLLALSGKPAFTALLTSFGLNTSQALVALQLIGCLDILVGLIILFKPNKLVLQWAVAWSAMTIVAWGIHGDNLADLARRATYLTTPMALLFLLNKNEKAIGKESFHQENLQEEIEQLSEEERAASLVAIGNLDLSMIFMKLMDQQEGVGWNQRQCAEVAHEYRRYLCLNLIFPQEKIVPNLAIDTMWHCHILDTAAYQKDCQAIFGALLHHYPYFGMQGEEDERQFVSAYDKTKILYERTFGESMDRADYLTSFRIRRSA